jgi:transposase
MWYAGIDWADDHHDIVVLDVAGFRVAALQAPHTGAGLAQLTAVLTSICRLDAKNQIACIVETTHGLLIAALLEAGFPLYLVNPKTVDCRRNAAGVKIDQIDAYLLAKTGRTDVA